MRLADWLPQSQTGSEEIGQFWSAYVRRLREALPDDLVYGVYLYGSLVLDAYEPGRSDLDFLTVLTRRLIESELEAVEQMHKDFAAVEPLASRLDGEYLAFADVGKVNEELDPYPYYHGGRVRSGKWDVNHTTLWMLQEHGLTVAGPEIETLPLAVTWEQMRETMRYNLHGYWTRQLRDNPFLHDDSADDGVLTLCRILHTLEHRDIVGKVRATEFALHTLSPEWHRPIHEALRLRLHRDEPPYYASDEQRAAAIRAFLQHVIAFCTEKYDLHSERGLLRD